MLYFPRWLVTLIFVACGLGVVLSVPNMFPQQMVEAWPRWVPKKQVSLGLDLRGGSYLLYEVDMRAALTQRLNDFADGMRKEFANAQPPIGYSGGLNVEGGQITTTLRDPARADDARALLRRVDPSLEMTVGSGGAISVKINDAAWQQQQLRIVEQSIEIVRRRIDESGTKEPSIQREGNDRIVLELPGIQNPEEVERLLGKTAKMTFQLVDENVAIPDRAHTPPTDELLALQESSRTPGGGFIVVQKRVMVSGENLTDAHNDFQPGGPVVAFRFDPVGARKFSDATSRNVGHRFAIVLDGKVISAPVIKTAITGGQGIIEGGFTVESANELALLLRAGALPAPLVALEKRTVGPDLGADAIHDGTLATTVGVILVVVFMVVFYGLFGLFANVALFFNLCLMLASLTLLGATLTLPGIAGIALTLGMAVDANVLIYERIREEVRGGRSLISSLQAGFERAFGTIFDSHLTTLVAGFVMFFLGSGPVKGFAVTLSIGVITSLFSAILVTRLQIVAWLRRTKPKAIPI
jgi:protein-export membrane protein SecD